MHKLQDLVNQAQAIPGLTSSLPAGIAAELTRHASGLSEASGGGAMGSNDVKPSLDIRFATVKSFLRNCILVCALQSLQVNLVSNLTRALVMRNSPNNWYGKGFVEKIKRFKSFL